MVETEYLDKLDLQDYRYASHDQFISNIITMVLGSQWQRWSARSIWLERREGNKRIT